MQISNPGAIRSVPHPFQVFTQPLDWPEDAPIPVTLSAEERGRAGRFIRPADRVRFAQSHAFLRQMLSRFAPVAPQDWQFTRGKFGRPSIAFPETAAPLDFNLSHTSDYAACVITRGISCGIDIECVRDTPQLLNIARARFAPEEFRALEELSEEARPRRFFELWTEKEAWAKAGGAGLSLPIDRIVGEIPGVTLERFEPTHHHAMAVVLLTGPALRSA